MWAMWGTPLARADVANRAVEPAAEAEPAAPVEVPADLAPEEWIPPGHHVRIGTTAGPIHVWTPEGYDPSTAITVVYVHGYYVDVDEAWLGHGLPEQFGAAGINAMFIACSAPGAKLDHVRWRSLSELLAMVEHELGAPLPKGRVAAIGHSGAYRTLLDWLRDRRLDTVVLLDAGYGEMAPFRDWIRARQDHRLISVGDDTIRWTTALHRWLPSTRKIEAFSELADRTLLDQLQHERVVHIRSNLGHMRVVTGGIALPILLRMLQATPLAIDDLDG